jgi:hypothetical protein
MKSSLVFDSQFYLGGKMKSLDKAKQKIAELGKCKAAFTVAQAAASACNQSYGVSLLRISAGLDYQNKKLVAELFNITKQSDYNNADQEEMMCWLSENGWLEHTPKAI